MAMVQALPERIGILAAEIYVPPHYVDHAELGILCWRCAKLNFTVEIADGVSAGKYTSGLGQKQMAICLDNEDIVSICLTVTKSLLEKYSIDPSEIGRLEVGTETPIDKAKSIKTHLLPLFGENSSLWGVDVVNACFGGTAALFNAVHWIESSDWDGRYALVVTGDIATYEHGPARATGGAGAIALLIGPNAPIEIERGAAVVHFEHTYDFYKPDPKSPFPYVDGSLSIECYYRALDVCYRRYTERLGVDLSHFDYIAFHSPYAKLPKKAFTHLHTYNSTRHLTKAELTLLLPCNVDDGKKCFDDQFEAMMGDLCEPAFERMTLPTLMATERLGNSYCASLYCSLLSLLDRLPSQELNDKRIGMFSYGSGVASMLFSLKITGSTESIATRVNLSGRLDARTKLSPLEMTTALEQACELCGKADWCPKTSNATLAPGTYFLKSVDSKLRRFYERVPLSASNHS